MNTIEKTIPSFMIQHDQIWYQKLGIMNDVILISDECDRILAEIKGISQNASLTQIQELLISIKLNLYNTPLHEIEFLNPFEKLITNEQTTDTITSLALSSINTFISYSLLRAEDINQLCDTIKHCQFQSTSDYDCLAVTYQILTCVNLLCSTNLLNSGSLSKMLDYLLTEIRNCDANISPNLIDSLSKVSVYIFSRNINSNFLQENLLRNLYLLTQSEPHFRQCAIMVLLHISRTTITQSLISTVCSLFHQSLFSQDNRENFVLIMRLFINIFAGHYMEYPILFSKCFFELLNFIDPSNEPSEIKTANNSPSGQNPNYKLKSTYSMGNINQGQLRSIAFEILFDFISQPNFLLNLFVNFNHRLFFSSLYDKLIQVVFSFPDNENIIVKLISPSIKLFSMSSNIQSFLDKEKVEFDQLSEFAIQFNSNPSSFTSNDSLEPPLMAKYLFKSLNLSRKQIGEFFGKNKPFCMDTLKEFLNLFDFSNLDFDSSIRLFLSSFQIAGEGQIVDRIFDYFSQRFYLCGSDRYHFKSSESVHLLSYGWLMLHTSFHNNNVTKKPLFAEFVQMMAKQNNGDDFDELFLKELFDSVKNSKVPFEDHEQELSIAHWRLQICREKMLDFSFVNIPINAITSNKKASPLIKQTTDNQKFIEKTTNFPNENTEISQNTHPEDQIQSNSTENIHQANQSQQNDNQIINTSNDNSNQLQQNENQIINTSNENTNQLQQNHNQIINTSNENSNQLESQSSEINSTESIDQGEQIESSLNNIEKQMFEEIWKIGNRKIIDISIKNNKVFESVCHTASKFNVCEIIDQFLMLYSKSSVEELLDKNKDEKKQSENSNLLRLGSIISEYGQSIRTDGWVSFVKLLTTLLELDLLNDDILTFQNIENDMKPTILCHRLVNSRKGRRSSMLSLFLGKRNSNEDFQKVNSNLRDVISKSGIELFINFDLNSDSHFSLIEAIVKVSQEIESGFETDQMRMAFCVLLIEKILISNKNRSDLFSQKVVDLLINGFFIPIMNKKTNDFLPFLFFNELFVIIMNFWEFECYRDFILDLIDKISMSSQIVQGHLSFEFIEKCLSIFFDKHFDSFIKKQKFKGVLNLIQIGLMNDSSKSCELLSLFKDIENGDFDNVRFPLIQVFSAIILVENTKNTTNPRSFSEMKQLILVKETTSKQWEMLFNDVLFPLTTKRVRYEDLLLLILDTYQFALDKVKNLPLFESIWFRLLSLTLEFAKRCNSDVKSQIEVQLKNSIIKMKEFSILTEGNSKIWSLTKSNVERVFPKMFQ